MTDLATVALVVLGTGQLGAITAIYGVYGLLGLLGHLGVDPLDYLRSLPLVLAAAVAYDVVVALAGHRRAGLLLGLPVFALLVSLGRVPFPSAPDLMAALAFGYSGLGVGFLLSRRWLPAPSPLELEDLLHPDPESPGNTEGQG